MSRQVENACQSSDHEQHAAAAPGECEARREQGGPLPCYVIIHNVSKRHNLGMIARSATAFGVAEICLVGSRKFSAFGSHGAIDHVQLRHFGTLAQCCCFLREERGCRVVGVELGPSAQPVHSHPFCGPTAFMLGNEGSGLSADELAACDALVYIPQHGPGTASLNVAVAASIMLHHFAVWAGYAERSRTGAKFDVGARPPRTARRGEVPLTPHEMEEERGRRRAAKAGLHQENGELDGVLGDTGWLLEPDEDMAAKGLAGNGA